MAEQAIDRLITLNENVVEVIMRMDSQIQELRAQVGEVRAQVEETRRLAEYTRRLWIAVAKHYGLLDEIDFDNI